MNFSHHAYGVFGEDSGLQLENVLKQFATNRKISVDAFTLSNPDFFRQKFETLTIDDSRRLLDVHSTMPFSADIPRVFVIELYGATREAQNALLKILEEPRPNNYFFIVAPTAELFLPTVLSRLSIVSLENANFHHIKNSKFSDSDKSVESAFLKMSLAEKIAYVDDLAARVSDEKAEKHDVVAFLNSLEKELYINGTISDSGTTIRNLPAVKFEAIARARDYVNDRAPSVKMLLEYVALSI